MAVLLLLAPQDRGVNAVVDGVVQRYSRMKDFSAEFEQTTKDSLNQRRTYRGLLYLKSGKRMLFEVKSPEHEITYSDGKTYVLFHPDLKRPQAEISKLGKAEDDKLQLFQIPWNPEWKKQFPTIARPSEKPRTPGNYMVLLIPDKKKDLPEVLLEVNPTTFLIERFVTTLPGGDVNEFSFKGIKTDPLNADMFVFNPPPGVQVIDNKK